MTGVYLPFGVDLMKYILRLYIDTDISTFVQSYDIIDQISNKIVEQ